ncbi:MAG: GxxExxY protein [Ignavibacteriaceae bacterium]
MLTQKYVNKIAYDIVGCAIEVHKHLGPGLLESVYESCMLDEIGDKYSVQKQVVLPVLYKGRNLGKILKLDLVVEHLVIVELKAVDVLHPVFKAQLLTYLKLTNLPKGLLINFNCDNITKSVVPLVTEEFSKLPKE